MEDAERAYRIASVVECYGGLGVALEKERLRWLLNRTRHIPLELYRDAWNAAALASDFPPNPHRVLEAAVELESREHRTDYSATAGRAKPCWYHAQRYSRDSELPQELAPRRLGDPVRVIAAEILDLDAYPGGPPAEEKQTEFLHTSAASMVGTTLVGGSDGSYIDRLSCTVAAPRANSNQAGG